MNFKIKPCCIKLRSNYNTYIEFLVNICRNFVSGILVSLHCFDTSEAICMTVFCLMTLRDIPGGSEIKNPPANAGYMGLILKLETSHGEGNGTQSSILV